MTEKRYLLKYLPYECSNGEMIETDPYYIDCKQEYVDTDDEFSIDGILTMSDEQVLDLLNENEQLKKEYNKLKHRHSLLHDVCIEAECDRDSYHKDVLSLEKENGQLKQKIEALEDANTGLVETIAHFDIEEVMR